MNDLEVRVGVLERELDRLLGASKDDAEFRAEMRAFMARSDAVASEKAGAAAAVERRVEAAEMSIRELEQFKAKILGAVAVAGVMGGTAGGIAAALFRLLGG